MVSKSITQYDTYILFWILHHSCFVFWVVSFVQISLLSVSLALKVQSLPQVKFNLQR